METTRAAMMAKDLMNYHGLSSWIFEMRPMKSLFGYCHYSKKLITLSSILTELNDEAQVLDTILHEIAHALAPKFAGHGPFWKQQAQSIGCNPVRCYSNTVQKPAHQFMGVCPKCYYTIKRHRRKTISCGRCNPKFDRALLFVWAKIV